MTGLLRNDCCLVLTDWSARLQFQTWEPKMCLSSITAAESCEPGDRQPWASKKVRILTTSTYLPATPRQQLGCWLLIGLGRLLRLSPVTAAFSRTMVVAGWRYWAQVRVICEPQWADTDRDIYNKTWNIKLKMRQRRLKWLIWLDYYYDCKKRLRMAGLQRFRYIDAAFIIGSIITFILDQATGEKIVGNSFDIIQSWADVEVRN